MGDIVLQSRPRCHKLLISYPSLAKIPVFPQGMKEASSMKTNYFLKLEETYFAALKPFSHTSSHGLQNHLIDLCNWMWFMKHNSTFSLFRKYDC